MTLETASPPAPCVDEQTRRPLVEIHPNAELAAEAAAAQGQFWPIHHLLFAQAHHLTPAALTGYALSLGLDMNRFNAEMIDQIYTQRIQEHRRAGVRSALRATPAVGFPSSCHFRAFMLSPTH